MVSNVGYGQQGKGNYSRKRKPTFQARINGKTRNLRVVSNEKYDKLFDVDEKTVIATRSKLTGKETGWGDALPFLPKENVPKDWNKNLSEMVKEIKDSKDLSPQTKDLIRKTFRRVVGYDLFN